MSHTPGPWESDEMENIPMVFLIRDLSGHIVAELARFTLFEDSILEAASNARLIAAAPELLEALKAVCDAGEWYCLGTTIEKQVIAAIAKAEGRP